MPPNSNPSTLVILPRLVAAPQPEFTATVKCNYVVDKESLLEILVKAEQVGSDRRKL